MSGAERPGGRSGQTPSSQVTPPATRQADPERGLRGVMSAILILEAITILLGIRVVQQLGDAGALDTAGVIAILVLAAAHIGGCALVRRRVFTGYVAVLQVALIGMWAVSASVGIIGMVFALVWVAVLWMRHAFRRHQALLARAGDPPAGDDG